MRAGGGRVKGRRSALEYCVAIGLCILAGVVTTPLVAWGLSLWGTVSFDPNFVSNVQNSEGGPLHGHFGFTGIGLRDVLLETTDVRPWLHRQVTWHYAGWPMEAFSTLRDAVDTTPYEFDPPAPSTSVPQPQVAVRLVEPGVEPPTWLARRMYERNTDYILRPPIPLRMIRRGFIVDTLFYAAVFAALLLVAPRVRSAIRRHRGLCPACGYSLVANTTGVCPECGSTSSHPPSASRPAAAPPAP